MWKIHFLNFYLHEIITSGDEVDFVLNWGLFVLFTTKLTCSVFSIDLGINVSSCGHLIEVWSMPFYDFVLVTWVKYDSILNSALCLR